MYSRWSDFSFSFQISMPHLESGQHAWYYSYSIIYTYPFQCGSWLSLLGSVGSQVAGASSHSLGCISSLESTQGGSVGLLMYQSVSVLLNLGNYSTSWCLQVECFQTPMDMPGELLYVSSFCFSSPCSILVPVRTGQFRLLILVAPCWMEDSWLSTVPNMLVDVLHWCPIIKAIIMDVSVGSMLKGLQSQHLTLWLLRDVCCADRCSLLLAVRLWQEATSAYMTKVCQQGQKEWTEWCA